MDDLSRQNQELSGWKVRLSQENFDLQRQVQELDTSNAALAKSKSSFQQQLESVKTKLDEESRVSVALVTTSPPVKTIMIIDMTQQQQ